MNTQLANKVKKTLCKDQDFIEVDDDLYIKFDALKIHYEENELIFSVVLNEEVLTEKIFSTSFTEGDMITLEMKGLFKLDLT